VSRLRLEKDSLIGNTKARKRKRKQRGGRSGLLVRSNVCVHRQSKTGYEFRAASVGNEKKRTVQSVVKREQDPPPKKHVGEEMQSEQMDSSVTLVKKGAAEVKRVGGGSGRPSRWKTLVRKISPKKRHETPNFEPNR